ncbi:glutamate 5-kinase [Candidatus Poriferisodalis sp.]|uniref:glutamate 5-kinase n=1 Tax=Candidatus Poriferisodalis sp. TaxID=3101277 RepID=UPI003B02AC12
MPETQLLIAKIGTSSITAPDGRVDLAAVAKLARDVAAVRAAGHEVIVVTSGAITAGVQRMNVERPAEPERLQALSAVGQIDLMASYRELFETEGMVVGQVLLAPHDFRDRDQYLHARATFRHLLDLGVVPIVNENDAVADDAIRYGDNDRIAALVANLVRADALILLTDMPGILTADPNIDPDASLISEILEVSPSLQAAAGSASAVGSGGMASKLAAARMASWSGVRTVIASARRPDVVADAAAGRPGVGTSVPARAVHVPARKLWIGFAVAVAGSVTVDDGARRAVSSGGKSLLAAGVVAHDGTFAVGDAVDIVDLRGETFAKGLAAVNADGLSVTAGLRSEQLPAGMNSLVVHRDDLVVLGHGRLGC